MAGSQIRSHRAGGRRGSRIAYAAVLAVPLGAAAQWVTPVAQAATPVYL